MLSWFSELTLRERRTMAACFGGWALDALDVQIFSFVIPTLLSLWHISSGQAGELATITLLVSAFGGWLGGALADRYGRMRVLQVTIVWYAVFTFLCGFAQNYAQLFVFRALQGIGFGGEWAAGAVLMGEVIRDRFRGRAVGLVQTGWAFGWGGAAIAYTVLFAFIRPELAFRVLFWLGILPALLVIWIRRNVAESDFAPREAAAASGIGHVVSALRPPHLATTWRLILMVVGAQGGSYALATWLPTYLKTVRHLTSVGAGSYLLVHILGALCGFIAGSFLSDAIGRKPTFLISALGSMAMVLIYLMAPIGNDAILAVGFPLGFVIYMMFPPMGPFMTELFPSAVRGTGQGFCYNAGRGVGALFPALVGWLTLQLGLGAAIVVFALFAYSLMVAGLTLLPETRGRSLESLDADARAQVPAPDS
ncbi:MAG TPA: MFS transporter [Acetobacteraceae bacterium]|nr:MFS transporter [Acetobacteraceae bacterium]